MAFPSDKLSSNWLRLKKKTTKSTNKIKKISKNTKKTTTQSIVEKITQSLDSKAKNTTSSVSQSSQDLQKWAHENDIPLNDVNKAYNLPSNEIEGSIKTSGNQSAIGKYIAIDCEFVGVGPNGSESALARVSLVNFHGNTIYDKFVKPREKVTDWRTWVSGVTPHHMKTAIDFKTAQKEVSELLDGRILVGHAVSHDLDALLLSHPKSLLRDTSKHPPYKKLAKGKTPGLKKLSKELLNIDIQGAEHSSVEDAKATMMLYKLDKKEFEKQSAALRFRKKE